MADTSLAEKKIGLLVWQLSNHWQSKLRKILKDYKLTLNEYLVLESISGLLENQKELSQNEISIFAGIDISVASVTFKLLENKKLIARRTKKDNRKKIIEKKLINEKISELHIKKVINQSDFLEINITSDNTLSVNS